MGILGDQLCLCSTKNYFIGRDKKFADIFIRHVSCSNRHAILYQRKDNSIKPFVLWIVDLRSKNGTFINGNIIKPLRCYKLFNKDLIKFGNSSREYVVMNTTNVTGRF